MLSLSQAEKIVETVLEHASKIQQNISVAVVDANGTLLCVKRMETSFVVSADFALAKAYTAAVFGMPTETIGQYSAPEKPYYGINTNFSGKFMVIAGGVPIHVGGKVVGAVGVGGSTDVGLDVECANAGVASVS